MFNGPRLKIKRANKHIDNLNAVVNSFARSDFHRLSTEFDANVGKHIVRFERDDIPEDVPLILGDAIHNMRAALDILACDIVISGGKTPTKWTRFPFYETREELVTKLAGGVIQASRPDIVDFIVNEIRPYPGGDDALVGLHNLDIDDKHRIILPVFVVTPINNVFVEDSNRNTVRIGTLIQGPNAQIAESFGQLKHARYENATLSIFFGDGNFFNGKPILPTLHELSQVVTGVVDAIERACGA